MNPLAFGHNYRVFKANNRYSYPFLFFALGALKSLCQLGALAVAGWVVYQGISSTTNSDTSHSNVAKVSVAAPVTAIAKQKVQSVEILAVSTDAINPPLVNPNTALEPLGDNATRLLDWEWVLKQDAEKFTIQYGSSPDEELLYESARAFPTESAVVVFPFKKTPSNRTVFGFSSGLYDSLDSAQQAIKELPQSARSFGPWIRPIGQLQKQIVVMLPG